MFKNITFIFSVYRRENLYYPYFIQLNWHTWILKSSSLILKFVKSQHRGEVNLIEIVHTCIYIYIYL